MQDILIESIRTDGAVQSRTAINPEYVSELAELIKNGQKLPPVDVYSETAGESWIADALNASQSIDITAQVLAALQAKGRAPAKP